MDWLHCNKCLKQPSEGSRNQYYLSECGHVTCHDCVVKTPSPGNSCPYCQARAKLLPIGNKMRPTLMALFQSNAEAAKRISRVSKFQHDHGAILSKLKDATQAQQEKAIQGAKRRMEDMSRELKQMTTEMQQLRLEKTKTAEELERVKSELKRAKQEQQLFQGGANNEWQRQGIDNLFQASGNRRSLVDDTFRLNLDLNSGDKEDAGMLNPSLPPPLSSKRPFHRLAGKGDHFESNYNVLDLLKDNREKMGDNGFLSAKSPMNTNRKQMVSGLDPLGRGDKGGNEGINRKGTTWSAWL